MLKPQEIINFFHLVLMHKTLLTMTLVRFIYPLRSCKKRLCNLSAARSPHYCVSSTFQSWNDADNRMKRKQSNRDDLTRRVGDIPVLTAGPRTSLLTESPRHKVPKLDATDEVLHLPNVASSSLSLFWWNRIVKSHLHNRLHHITCWKTSERRNLLAKQ